MQKNQSLERLLAIRKHLSFIVRVLNERPEWDHGDIESFDKARAFLDSYLKEVDVKLARTANRIEKQKKREKVLKGMLYSVACLNALYVAIARREASDLISSIAIAVLFILALFRWSPLLSTLRTLVVILLPVIAILILYSIAPIRIYLTSHLKEISILSLLYAILFPLIGDRILKKEVFYNL